MRAIWFLFAVAAYVLLLVLLAAGAYFSLLWVMAASFVMLVAHTAMTVIIFNFHRNDPLRPEVG